MTTSNTSFNSGNVALWVAFRTCGIGLSNNPASEPLPLLKAGGTPISHARLKYNEINDIPIKGERYTMLRGRCPPACCELRIVMLVVTTDLTICCFSAQLSSDNDKQDARNISRGNLLLLETNQFHH
mmetsp:Transcript_8206/g.14858  ORF Transcript_8206/g.14858 Transcript_8206/m.14858 type:complete len:127 (+) Transcript_8206:2661-3041(+)